MAADSDRTASLMTPSKLAQMRGSAPPPSPSAWLDQMAADAGHLHLQRLAELRDVLKTHARARLHAGLAAVLEQLKQQLPQIDYSLLEPQGWWARTTGKTRSAGAEFAAQFEAVEEAGKALAAQVRSLQERAASEAAATERTLVEMDVEVRALQKIIEQAGRWLHDMRGQLKSRLDTAADDAARTQVQADAARAEILAGRLKLLRAAAALAEQVHEEAQATAAARVKLLERMQQLLGGEWKAWHARVAPLAAAASDGKAPAAVRQADIDTARQALAKRIERGLVRCAELQTAEDELADAVEGLAGKLQAAAA